MRSQGDDYRKPSALRRYALLAGALLLSLAAAGCEVPKSAESPVRPVKAVVVPAPLTKRTLTFSGVLTPRIESAIGFRVGGKIVERYVNVGDTVRRGQKIARLDETDLKLSENSARANLKAAQTRLAVARDAYDRATQLLPKGFIAKAAVDQRQLEFDSAQSAFNAAQDQLNQAMNATSYALLEADQDGTVTSVRAEPGQVVGVGQPVVTLAQAGDLEVAVSIPEQDIAFLKVGDPATVSLWAEPSVKAEGKIREIAGAADPASRTYAVRISVISPSDAMRLGMTTSVSLEIPQPSPAMVLPLSALAERDGQPIVYVVDRASKTVSSRAVELMGVAEQGAKVKSGLTPGEVVVTGGVQFLRDGLSVRLPQELAAAGSAAVN